MTYYKLKFVHNMNEPFIYCKYEGPILYSWLGKDNKWLKEGAITLKELSPNYNIVELTYEDLVLELL